MILKTTFIEYIYDISKVINSGSSGQQLDISFYIRDPNKKYVKFESRKAAGGLMEQIGVLSDLLVSISLLYRILLSCTVLLYH